MRRKTSRYGSRMFTESLEDIFEIENTVAEVVAEQLKVSLSPEQKHNLKRIAYTQHGSVRSVFEGPPCV
jgi:hypothetical protein